MTSRKKKALFAIRGMGKICTCIEQIKYQKLGIMYPDPMTRYGGSRVKKHEMSHTNTTE